METIEQILNTCAGLIGTVLSVLIRIQRGDCAILGNVILFMVSLVAAHWGAHYAIGLLNVPEDAEMTQGFIRVIMGLWGGPVILSGWTFFSSPQFQDVFATFLRSRIDKGSRNEP